MRYPVEPLTTAEVNLLLKGCSNRCPTGVRNRALIVLLWRCGLRLAEALALERKDIDLNSASVRVLHGKGDKSRVVGIDETAKAVLVRWLEWRIKKLGFASEPLFCTLDGKRLQQPYIRNLLKRLARKAGITKRVHAHGLRHSFAAQAIQEGMPLNLLQSALGHANLQTTSIYVSHIQPQQVIDAMRGRTVAPVGSKDELLRLRAEIDRALALVG